MRGRHAAIEKPAPSRAMSALPPFTSHFAALAPGYDVVLSDVTVVLITNAPRPGEVVVRTMLDRLKVPRAAYDGIISSGDVTRALIAARGSERVFHIGPKRDLPMFEGLDARVTPLEHRRDAAGLPRPH